MKTGNLFDADKGLSFGELRVAWMRKYLPILAKFFYRGGIAISLLGSFYVIYLWGPFLKSWYAYKTRYENVSQGENIVVENKKTQEKIEDGYWIYVDKIGARSQVIPQVSASDKRVYVPALKRGVAEAAGLSVPGEMGTTLLFAHSAQSELDLMRFNAVFYLLGELRAGDGIRIIKDRKEYKYEVVESKILLPSDVSFFVPQDKEEKLILVTCYPPGTTLRRLYIIAKRVV